MPPTVLCDAAQDLERCMVPMMCLDGDEIVEASLLGPADGVPKTSPTPEEEAVHLGDELEPQEAEEATICPCEHLGAPKAKNQPSSLTLHACLPLSCSTMLQW